MLPQEIRSMPDNKLVMLVEGQRPIMGYKLRYYAMEPFRKASVIAKARKVVIPDVELPVSSSVASQPGTRAEAQPAPAEDRGNGGDKLRSDMAMPERIADAVAAAIATDRPQASGAQRLAREAASDERLLTSARRLTSAVAASLSATPAMSIKRRRSIAEILAVTVPDPADIGLD
jgi:type IV secretion system protein VirD4